MMPAAEVGQVIKCTIELLEDPKRFTQHAMARDKYDQPVSPNAPGATCFCVFGALLHCAANEGVVERSAMHLKLTNRIQSLTGLNDTGPKEVAHSRILAALKAAL